MSDEARQDDKSISDADRLLRRIPPNQLCTESDGTKRPSSANFKTPELSVNIESLMNEQGRAPEDTLTDHPGEYLVAVTAGRVREFNLPIVKQTEPPHDPAHGLVLGKKTGSFANAMVRSYEWVVAPHD